jgi:hypothetical protein
MKKLNRPPTAARVAARARVLVALVNRGFLEQDKEGDRSEAAAYREGILAWADAAGWREEAEPDEWRRIEAPCGFWTAREASAAPWRCEGAAVLAWALGVFPLPDYDREADPRKLSDVLGFCDAEIPPALADASLREAKDVADLSTLLLSLQWRLRQFGVEQKTIDFVKVAGQPMFRRMGLRLEGLRMSNNDVLIRGTPIVELPYTEWIACMGIAEERRRAVLWLQGQSSLYSEVDTPT